MHYTIESRHGRIMAALGVVVLVGGLLGPISVAEAEGEVVIELVPHRPGPYAGGAMLAVDVWLHSQIPVDVRLYYLQLDFSITDPALILDPVFTFDYSAIPDASGYRERHPELPVPWTANTLDCGCPDARLPLPAGGSLHIGSIGVEMPIDLGVYRLDTLNPEETEWTGGAMFSCIGGGPCKPWRASDGEIAGGTLDFVVSDLAIPTVSQWGLVVMTLLLLVLGSLAIMRRNKELTEPMRVSGHAGRPVRGSDLALIGVCALGVAALSTTVVAQPAPIASETVIVSYDTGIVSATGTGTAPVVCIRSLSGTPTRRGYS